MRVLRDIRGALPAHARLGASTGCFKEQRGDWPSLVEDALDFSSAAVELAALDAGELPGLVDFVSTMPRPPSAYVSVHAPSKGWTESPVAQLPTLAALPDWVHAIVAHPDTIADPDPYRLLGGRLAIENMDARKSTGRTTDELSPFFDQLPEAGLCFDIAHAKSIDPTLEDARRMLERFADRLRHVHVSSLDAGGGHVALSDKDASLFAPLLELCDSVPWIVESPIERRA